jgi:hypothetical protein
MADALSDRFAEVDLENDGDRYRLTFIEKASYKSLLSAFIAFILFESAYIYAAANIDLSPATTTLDHPLTQAYNNRMADIRIGIDSLVPANQYIRLTGALLRHSVLRDWNGTILVNASAECADGAVLRTPRANLSYAFQKSDDVSSSISILNIPIKEFNAIALNVTFETDLFFCKGFRFTYSFADPTVARFENTARTLLSGCALYSFVAYIASLRAASKSSLQIAAIAVGAAAVLSPNPLALFLPAGFAPWLAPVLAALFLAVFRWFVLYLIDSTVHESGALLTRWALAYGPLVAAYAAAEVAAVFGAGRRLLGALHTAFAVAVLALLTGAFLSTDRLAHFRIVCFGVFVLAAVLATLASEVAAPAFGFKRTQLRSLLLYQATHVFAVIVFLFFQRSAGPRVPAPGKRKGKQRR